MMTKRSVNDQGGVFAVSRGIFDDPDFLPEPFTQREAFMWLVANAAWKSVTVRGSRGPVRLNRAELCFSYRFLAERWKWSTGSARGKEDGSVAITKDNFFEIWERKGTAVAIDINDTDHVRSFYLWQAYFKHIGLSFSANELNKIIRDFEAGSRTTGRWRVPSLDPAEFDENFWSESGEVRYQQFVSGETLQTRNKEREAIKTKMAGLRAGNWPTT